MGVCYNHALPRPLQLTPLQLTDSSFMTKRAVINGLITGIGLCLVSATAGASTFNLGINNDSVGVGLKSTLSRTSQFNANYLYTDKQGKTLDLGFLTVNNSGGKRMAIGGKVLKLWSKRRNNGHAMALGGDFRMPIMPGISATIEGYFAPTVLSASGIENYYSIDARLMYAIMPTADLYLGYRDLEFRFENERDQTLDQSFYLGVEFKF